jgi:hypothetical protein
VNNSTSTIEKPVTNSTSTIDRLLGFAGRLGVGPDAKTSVYSKALALAGRFLGSPAKHGMPSDFYNLQGERSMPTPDQCSKGEILRDRVAVDNYRRLLTWNAGLWMSVVTFLVAIAWLVAFGALVKGTSLASRAVSSASFSISALGSEPSLPSAMTDTDLTAKLQSIVTDVKETGRKPTAQELEVATEYQSRSQSHSMPPIKR